MAAKARPFLVISDKGDPRLDDVLGLQLLRFSKVDAAEAEQIREQTHPLLFHLRPNKFPGLPEENAAMIAAPVRVHRSAIDGKVLGRLDSNELAIVHERFARYHEFDLRMLVREKLEELAARQAQRKA